MEDGTAYRCGVGDYGGLKTSGVEEWGIKGYEWGTL